MLKQGTTFSLAVDFKGIDLDKVEHIEFIFRGGRKYSSKFIKQCSWPGEAQREEGGSRILVPWTEAETWLVPGDGTFTLNGSQWVSVTSGSSSYSECASVAIYRV